MSPMYVAREHTVLEITRSPIFTVTLLPAWSTTNVIGIPSAGVTVRIDVAVDVRRAPSRMYLVSSSSSPSLVAAIRSAADRRTMRSQ